MNDYRPINILNTDNFRGNVKTTVNIVVNSQSSMIRDYGDT